MDDYRITAGAHMEATRIVNAITAHDAREATLFERIRLLAYRMCVEAGTPENVRAAMRELKAWGPEFGPKFGSTSSLAKSATVARGLFNAGVHPAGWHTMTCKCELGDDAIVTEFAKGSLRYSESVDGCVNSLTLYESYVSKPKPAQVETSESAKPAEPAKPAKPATVETAHRTPAELVMAAMTALARADKLISAGAAIPVQELAALSHNYGHLVATVKATRARVA